MEVLQCPVKVFLVALDVIGRCSVGILVPEIREDHAGRSTRVLVLCAVRSSSLLRAFVKALNKDCKEGLIREAKHQKQSSCQDLWDTSAISLRPMDRVRNCTVHHA